jgi:RNA polymerase sigma-70 factor (ECF subfamily)
VSLLPSIEAGIDDETLFEKIQGRDAGAFDVLYERYGRQAFALAYHMVSSREVAEEVTQDAFLSAWRQASTYNGRVGLVRPWLLSIVHHRAIDRLRRSRDRQPAASLDEAWMMPSTVDVFRDVYVRLRREQIDGAMLRLPPEQRQAINLSYFRGNTFAEISEMIGVPVGTVKSRVRLAIEKLKHLLDADIAA